MKTLKIFKELDKILGDKAKVVKQMLKKGYHVKEVKGEIAPIKLPADLVALLEDAQDKRFKRSKFNRKHKLYDIKTYLRHLLKVKPEDPSIQKYINQIRVPFAFLKHLTNTGEIVDFFLDLEDIKDNAIDVAFIFLPGALEEQQKQVVKQVDAIMQELPN